MTATLDLICFPGAPNLPVFVAQDQGMFARRGLTVNLSTTPASAFQAEGLAAGKFQIAGTAFDNVVAYDENQGAVQLKEPADFVAFMGATQVELAFVVSPDITGYADLKGKSLALDALATGFAFVLYRMLEKAGLSKDDVKMVPVGATPQRWESVKAGTHVGTLTIEPFTSIAKSQGFKVLDTSGSLFDVYQGGSFAARRSWAEKNPATVKAFIEGYLDGLDWTLDPANRAAATETLLRHMPEIKPPVAPPVMASLLSPKSGLTPNAALLMEGVAKVLELRTAFGTGKAPLTDPKKYIDLRWYDDVMAARSAKAKDGTRLAYRLYANPGKPKLMLIHSLALSGAIWDGVVKELRGDFEILVPDCRGHGASEKKPGPYTTSQFADDMAAILDHVGWKSAIVAGCSMGGCVAQAFAIAYPARTERLALVDTTAWYGAEAPKAWKERADQAAAKGLKSLMTFQLDRWFSGDFAKENPAVAANLGAIFCDNDIKCYQATCEMLGSADLRGGLAGLKMPTAVIVGEEDYATPVAMAEHLHGAIKGSTLDVIKKGRHLTPVQCPAEIGGFIRALTKR